MPTKSVNVNIQTPLGTVQIYTDPRQQARVEKLITKTPSILTQGYKKGTEKFGNQLLRIVKRSLNTGMPPPGGGSWRPHAPSTIKKYGAHTLLNLTGQYARSVTLVRTKNRTFVGLPIGRDKVKVTRSGNVPAKRTLNQIAIILEYGSRDGNTPSRPLWRPAFEAAGGKNALHREIRYEVRKEIRKYT